MNKRWFMMLIIAGVYLFGCRLVTAPTVPVPSPTPPPRARTSHNAPGNPAAILTRLQGDVQVQHGDAGQTVRASFGDYLWPGDVIVTGQEAHAEAVCSDGIALQVDPNQKVTVTCGQSPAPVYQRVILNIHDGQIETLPATRLASPASGDRPVISSPRNTRLADQRPTIRWTAVQHATAYQVIVRSPGGDLWQATTTEIELPYPQAQPALQRGSSYIVQVIAQLGPTEQPRASKEVLLTLLPAAEAEQVQQVETQVEALGLSQASTRLFLGGYHVDMQLYDAAIRDLTPLCQNTPSPLACRLLGDAYLAVELDREAITSYRKASTLAREQDSRLIEAQAEVGLGHASYAAARFAEALEHYQAALNLYRELEMGARAAAVAELVAHTETRLPTAAP